MKSFQILCSTTLKYPTKRDKLYIPVPKSPVHLAWTQTIRPTTEELDYVKEDDKLQLRPLALNGSVYVPC